MSNLLNVLAVITWCNNGASVYLPHSWKRLEQGYKYGFMPALGHNVESLFHRIETVALIEAQLHHSL